MGARSLKVVVAGLGYFSRFHQVAWSTQPGATLVGVCDPDEERLTEASQRLDVPGCSDLATLLTDTPADIIDIVAPPMAHADLVRAGLAPGRTIICQKPFCLSIEEARAVMADAAAMDTRIVIHENFRFQPWYRTIKRFLDSERMGRVYQARFALRPGDGRGPGAYLARQPAFQTMPRLLIHETGVHFVDLFRWLFGEVRDVYADLRRLNPVLAGEDAGLVVMNHASQP